MHKKSSIIFLTITLILALGTPIIHGYTASIPETNKNKIEEIMPIYEIGTDIVTSFTITNNTANLRVIVGDPNSKTVSITMVLQQKKGDSWTKVQKWTKEGKGNQTLSKRISVTKGQKYRMKYTVTVGSETVTGKTDAKTA